MQSLGRAAFVAATATLLLACGTGTDQAGQGQSPPAAAQSVRKNACDLIDRAAIEGIAGRTLEMLHDIEADDKTTCELHPPGDANALVYVTVYWSGGKELAQINQAATGMAKALNDADTDIEDLTGSGAVRGLGDGAYYSNVMPSWVLKGDVFVEILSPQFNYEQTKAVFLSVAKTAVAKL